MIKQITQTMNSAVKIVKEHLNKDFDLLILYVTDLCNAKCGHCFYADSLNKSLQMDFGEMEKISLKLPKFHSLNLTGGEPFLRRNIVDITKLFYKNNQIKDLWIPSNGMINPTEKALQMLQSCPELNVTINFSIDDLKERHDEIRGVPCFDKVVESAKNLMKLKKEHPEIKDRLRASINTVIHSKNFDHMQEIAEFIKTLGVDYHSFEPMRGDPKNKDLRPLTPEEFKKYKKIAYDTELHYMDYKNIGLMYVKRYRNIFYQNQENSINGKPWNTNCTAGITSAVIYANGDTGACELLKKVGNIKDYDYDLLAMMNSEKGKKLKKFIKDTKCHCTHCVFLSNTMKHSIKCL